MIDDSAAASIDFLLKKKGRKAAFSAELRQRFHAHQLFFPLSVLSKSPKMSHEWSPLLCSFCIGNSGQMRFLLPGLVIFLRDKSSSAPTASPGWSKGYAGSSCVLLSCSVYTANVWIKAHHRVPSCIIPQNKHTWPGEAYETQSHQRDKPPPL